MELLSCNYDNEEREEIGSRPTTVPVSPHKCPDLRFKTVVDKLFSDDEDEDEDEEKTPNSAFNDNNISEKVKTYIKDT